MEAFNRIRSVTFSTCSRDGKYDNFYWPRELYRLDSCKAILCLHPQAPLTLSILHPSLLYSVPENLTPADQSSLQLLLVRTQPLVAPPCPYAQAIRASPAPDTLECITDTNKMSLEREHYHQRKQ